MEWTNLANLMNLCLVSQREFVERQHYLYLTHSLLSLGWNVEYLYFETTLAVLSMDPSEERIKLRNNMEFVS